MGAPDNYDPEKLHMISDFLLTAEALRKEGIKEFNLRYAEDCMKLDAGVYKTGRKRRWTKQGLEEVFPLARVQEIMKDTLPYVQSENRYCINAKHFAQVVEKITKGIFFNVCNKLVDAGILELIFSPDSNDFAYRVVKKPDDEYTF
jgi:hypothetical protein